MKPCLCSPTSLKIFQGLTILGVPTCLLLNFYFLLTSLSMWTELPFSLEGSPGTSTSLLSCPWEHYFHKTITCLIDVWLMFSRKNGVVGEGVVKGTQSQSFQHRTQNTLKLLQASLFLAFMGHFPLLRMSHCLSRAIFWGCSLQWPSLLCFLPVSQAVNSFTYSSLQSFS